MSAATKLPKTFEQLWKELARVPEGFVGEIVAGEVVVHPRPNDPHVAVQTDLGGVLAGPFRFGNGGPGGWVFRIEPRIRFADELRVPDVTGWSAERFSAPREGPLTVSPDWVCEVLSARTAATDRSDKMPLYAKHGVKHLWLIDPLAQSLEVYRLHEGSWLFVNAYAADARIRAEPFDAIEIDLVQVWGPKIEPAEG